MRLDSERRRRTEMPAPEIDSEPSNDHSGKASFPQESNALI
jgi:hypothetical protein